MTGNFNYHNPVRIVYGMGSLNEINRYIDGRKTLLVTSEGFIKRGLVDNIKKYTDHIVYVVSNIRSHPEFKHLENIYKEIHKIDFEIILAIGGGSVIDSAKIFSVYNKKREFNFVNAMSRGEIKKKNYNLIPLIAIPTTAGTGSELTPWATIWDMEEKKKYSLHLDNLFPDVAIYDPMLTLSVPKEITIQTGLDTLSHALESIWNKNANPISTNHAINSAKLIMEYLPKLANELDNIEYRDKVMLACMFAGSSFSNTQTALAHAISYYITAEKGVPHGIACSFMLPTMIDSITGKYDLIDEALFKIFGENGSKKIRYLFDELAIPVEFNDYGMNEKDMLILRAMLDSSQRAGNSLVSFEEIEND